MSAQILIADDDPDVCMSLRAILESAGYSVLEASHGGIAMVLVREQPIDLAIVDIFMPVQDGLETILQMRGHAPQLKIVAISGGGVFGLTDMLQVAGRMGADRVLAKPFSRQALLAVVGELLADAEV